MCKCVSLQCSPVIVRLCTSLKWSVEQHKLIPLSHVQLPLLHVPCPVQAIGSPGQLTAFTSWIILSTKSSWWRGSSLDVFSVDLMPKIQFSFSSSTIPSSDSVITSISCNNNWKCTHLWCRLMSVWLSVCGLPVNMRRKLILHHDIDSPPLSPKSIVTVRQGQSTRLVTLTWFAVESQYGHM